MAFSSEIAQAYLSNYYCMDHTGTVAKRERIVVLGTGWGAHSFLQSIDATKYEVVVVSPRNFFLHTPLLSSSAVGTVEYRSITEVSMPDMAVALSTPIESSHLFLSMTTADPQCEPIRRLSGSHLHGYRSREQGEEMGGERLHCIGGSGPWLSVCCG